MRTLFNITICLISIWTQVFSQSCLPTITTTPVGTFGGVFDETCIKFAPQAGDILYYQSNGTWEYQSPDINIKPLAGTNWSFHAKGTSNSSTGNLHLNAFRGDLTVTTTPATTVEKDHMLEVSFTYPSIFNKIQNFLNDPTGIYKPSYESTSGYVTGFNNGAIINPYDPDHISVDGIFWRPNTNVDGLIKYGFYYKGYRRITNNWEELSNTDEWRIRFSPDQSGTWYYCVNIWIGGKLVAQSGVKQIVVTNTTDPGYVKVAKDAGENKQYLKFSNNNQTFIPIGNNYAWTMADYTGVMHLNKELPSDWRMRPDAYLELQQAMDRLAGPNNERGNATRLVFCDWSFHIEMERLNNYNSRQIEMWELDDYLSELENRNMYLTLGIILQDEFNSRFGWDKNPYNINVPVTDLNKKYKGVAGVQEARDFYSNVNAMKFLKKRLRYINARWGYSKNLMLYELHSEIDNTGLFSDPSTFVNDTTIMGDWYDEMANYMKMDLKCKQLVSISIGGGTNTKWQNLELFKHENLDIVLPHNYFSREADTRLTAININNIKSCMLPKQKPIFVQECGNNGYMDNALFCSDLSYHQVNWSYNFTGVCGSLYWPYAFLRPTEFSLPPGYDPDLNISTHPPYEGEYYTNLKGIRNFFSASGVDFRTKKYQSYTKLDASTNNQWYEMQYLVSEDKNTILGWFHNRSSNQFNCLDCLNDSWFDKNFDRIVTNFNDFKNYECTSGTIVPWWNKNSPITIGRPDISNECQDPPLITWHGEDNYNFSFPSSSFPTNLTGMVGKGLQPLSITGINSGTYNVQWYWTWDDASALAGSAYNGDVLVPNLSVNGNKTSNGTLNFYSPPTVWYGSQPTIYPGDWAFIIKYGAANKSGNVLEGTGDAKPFELDISPNPTTGVINIFSNAIDLPYSLQIFDSRGCSLSKIENINVSEFKLNIADRSTGIYFLKVVSKERSNMFKIIKL